MTETLFDYEVQLRQSRLHDSKSDKKSSSSEFDVTFSEFLAVAGVKDCESCETSKDFTQQEFYQPPARNATDYRDDKEIFQIVDYPQADYSQTDYRQDDYRQADENRAPLDTDRHADNDEYDSTDDVSKDSDLDRDNPDESKQDDAESDYRQQENPEQDNDEAVTNQQPVNNVADSNEQDINSNPLSPKPAEQNDDLAKFGNLLNNNAGLNQPQATSQNSSGKIELQVEQVPAQKSATLQASFQQTEQPIKTLAPAGQSDAQPQANIQQNSAQQNPRVDNPQATTSNIAPQIKVASEDGGAPISINKTQAASQPTASTEANPNINPTGNDNATLAKQTSQAAQTDANIPAPQHAAPTDAAQKLAQETSNNASKTQRALLEELPVVPNKTLTPVITLPAEKSATPQTVQTALAGQANTGQVGSSHLTKPANTQGNQGQKLSDVPIENITVTNIQKAKQVKNIEQPLRVKGEQLLQTQEQGGSKLLQDLKQVENSPALARAEKSVFDARNIAQTQQNSGQSSIPAQQVADKTLRGFTQAEQPNSTQNPTQNSAAATRQYSGGEQQSQQQHSQPQPQPQSTPSTQASNGQAGSANVGAEANSNTPLASRFSSHMQDSLQQTHKMHQQISLKIQQAHQAHEKRINIQLRPVELGRVDVQIETLANGKMQLTIAPEKLETLELLQRDASTLQQALQNSGLDVDGKDLNFLLRQEFAENRKNSQQASLNNKQNGENGEEENQLSPDDILDEYVNISDDGRINARV